VLGRKRLSLHEQRLRRALNAQDGNTAAHLLLRKKISPREKFDEHSRDVATQLYQRMEEEGTFALLLLHWVRAGR